MPAAKKGPTSQSAASRSARKKVTSRKVTPVKTRSSIKKKATTKKSSPTKGKNGSRQATVADAVKNLGTQKPKAINIRKPRLVTKTVAATGKTTIAERVTPALKQPIKRSALQIQGVKPTKHSMPVKGALPAVDVPNCMFAFDCENGQMYHRPIPDNLAAMIDENILPNLQPITYDVYKEKCLYHLRNATKKSYFIYKGNVYWWIGWIGTFAGPQPSMCVDMNAANIQLAMCPKTVRVEDDKVYNWYRADYQLCFTAYDSEVACSGSTKAWKAKGWSVAPQNVRHFFDSRIVPFNELSKQAAL